MRPEGRDTVPCRCMIHPLIALTIHRRVSFVSVSTDRTLSRFLPTVECL